MILEKNLEALYNRYGYLKDFTPSFNCTIEVTEAKNGELTLKYKDKFIHSKYNPTRESDKIIRELESNNLYILGGIGLGYYLSALINRGDNGTIIIYEPSIELFSSLINSIDITNFINNPRAIFIVGPHWESIIDFLSGKRVKKVSYIPLTQRVALDLELFTPMEEYLKKYNRRVDINKNTLKKFGKLWVKNQCMNLQAMGYKGDISNFFGTFNGKPGIIVSAGPSLEVAIPHLKALKERFVILAVDTAYKTLIEEGIEPDFVMSIDAQYWNARHLEGVKSKRSILIADPSIQPAAIREFPGRVYFTKSNFPLGHYFEGFREPLTKIASGGSVSTTIWDFSLKLGLSEVYIVGQDLGYPGHITHYKNSYFEKRMINLCNRLNPIENQSFNYIFGGYPTEITSNTSKKIISDKRMKIYIEWFNEQVKNRSIRSFNLSPNGAKLEGIPFKDIKEILDYPRIREDLDKLIDSWFIIDSKTHLPNLLKGAMVIEKELNSLTNLGKRALNLSRSIKWEYQRSKPIDKLLIELSKIDSEIVNCGYSSLLSFIFEPIIDEITKEITKNPYQALLNSIKIYENLSRTGELHLKQLNYSIKNIELILKDAR